MVIYILKFSACLAVFMLFYKLVLERENIHHFKRFYLLAALVISAAIPFITFTTFVEPTPIENTIVFSNFGTINKTTEIAPTFSDYLPSILWAIYCLGLLVFSGRFTSNLYQLVKRIKQNPKFKKGRFVHVLLSDLIYPHTFLQYIFLNKSKYEAHKIPHEVLLHEETHAKQKHALDILFIELMQIIFWFNPLLYFIKKDIKLNHEFLADQAVLKTGTDTKTYQHILLAFSASKTMEDAQTHHLANAINYSLIKKRFTVMKSHTSNTVKWVKGLIILPVLAVLIYSFSSRKEVFIPIEPDVILSETPKELLSDELKQVNAYTIEHGENPENNLIENRQNGASKEQIAEYNKLAKYYNSQDLKNKVIKLTDMKRLNHLYNLMTQEQKKNAEPLPTFPPPPPPPTQSMTKSEEQDYKNQINKSKKGESYTYQYQNNDGKIVKVIVDENDLSIPPPPPPVPADASPEQKAKYKKISNEYYKKYKVKNGKVSERLQPPPPPAPPAPPKTMAVGKKIDQAYYDSLGTVTNNKTNKEKNPWGITTVATNEQSDSTTPENPPVPTEHMKQLNNEGASFSYNGKNITGVEAIILTQINSNLHIYVSKSTDTQKAIVKINDRLEGTATSEEIQRSIKNKEISAAYAKEHPEKVTQKKSESGETIQIVEVPADLLDSETPESAYDFVKSLKDDDIQYFYNDKQVSYNDILEITKKEPHINVSTKITDGKGTVHFTSVK
ncbi:Signal transducer regulating beta-lactamase production, contains metallopeptidase domain [Bizionia echini]|uniref:Signal transducer regulating beta-lactamase production, contains metallopeptidase domain n=1 Tax=Bizionia echini TaxID=649333 RepID=A0A1I4YSA9_9FLAO|nr:M56 family metallopeptidase [Bizionia echini]SFN40901.1 Signal transducer regulating beta-lactamase production, contains metallopeptidase domain [Bizionia echini]